LTLLKEVLLDTGCRLHAYVLMDNHAHLLVTPPGTGAISRLMQKLGRGYVGQFNARHQRTGTLWEGRYKACLVDNESYVLRCHRYIDLNPVRARMVDDPTAYPWSSCASHCGQCTDALITPHPAYVTLGATRKTRADVYRHLLYETLSDDDLFAIRSYLQQQRALGKDDFRAMVEAKTRRFAAIRPAHRPPHHNSNGRK
jgi:putative transposase